MKLICLRCENFRNITASSLQAHPEMNVIWGKNAQGKTNLLESIWLLTGGHSFRGAKDADLLQRDCPSGKITASFFAGEREQQAEITFANGKKSLVLNGVPQKSCAALAGTFCAVIFSPEHLSLMKDGPALRRKFMDTAICQLTPKYAVTLSAYGRAVQQRNAVLKDSFRHPELSELLDVWDRNVAGYGAKIVAARQQFCRAIAGTAEEIYAGISKNREQLSLKYAAVGCDADEENREEQLYKALLAARKEDLHTGSTSVGPHRDDMEVLINGLSARIYGSQGQQRSAVLALKLAEARQMETVLREPPVILLDDVMSELDEERQSYLLQHIDGKQVFITCCSPETLGLMNRGACIQVTEGKIALSAENPSLSVL